MERRTAVGLRVLLSGLVLVGIGVAGGVTSVVARPASAEVFVIQATASGWHIFGVAWHWWLIGATGLALWVRWLLQRRRIEGLIIAES